MSISTPHTGSYAQKWGAEVLNSYIRQSGFEPFIGRSADNIIVNRNDFDLKNATTINIPVVGKLRSRGLNGRLNVNVSGNEESLQNWNFALSVDAVINGSSTNSLNDAFTEIDLYNELKPALKNWSKEDFRLETIFSLYKITDAGSTTGKTDLTYYFGDILEDSTGGYLIENGSVSTQTTFMRRIDVSVATATTAQRNTWVVNNTDRIYFGKDKTNNTGVLSTSLANVDTTNDKMTRALVTAARRMARDTTSGIAPITPYQNDGDGKEYFVLFCAPYAFAQLKTDLETINKDGRPREGDGFDKNPLFQAGDLMWDGVIIREIPELPKMKAVGAASCDVEASFLCGCQALALGWGKKPVVKGEVTNHEITKALSTQEIRGLDKISINGKQRAVVTIFTAVA